MEVFRCTNGMGAGHSWSPSTFCSMPPSGAAADCPAKSATSSGPHSPESGEDVGYPPICGSQCQVGGRQGTRGQVGDSIGRHGRHGRSRGRVGACSPQACTRGSPGCSSRHPNQRVRIVLRTSYFPLEELDTKRAVICQNIEMSKKRLGELKAQSVSPPVQEDGAEVQHLRMLVSQLQAQIETLRQNPSRDNQPEGPVLKRQCRREDFVPQCHEEMEEWMAGRHADLQTAMVSGTKAKGHKSGASFKSR